MSSIVRQFENAVNLLIAGALADEGSDAPSLSEVLDAAQRAVDDWAENGDSADANVSVSLNAPRSPYNISKAIESLLKEAVDLNGVEYGRVIIKDLTDMLDTFES